MEIRLKYKLEIQCLKNVACMEARTEILRTNLLFSFLTSPIGIYLTISNVMQCSQLLKRLYLYFHKHTMLLYFLQRKLISKRNMVFIICRLIALTEIRFNFIIKKYYFYINADFLTNFRIFYPKLKRMYFVQLRYLIF